MKKNLRMVMLFLCMIGINAYAQDRVVTGTVTDKADGIGLPGVSVVVKGTRQGSQTNAAGKFIITAPAGSKVLTITSLGYKSVDVDITDGPIVIALEPDAKNLSEVVVVGALGIERKAGALAYSVAKVSGEDVNAAHPNNLQNGLVGKVSGLNVSTVNNGVNASTRIDIRGIRSLTGNNQPLLVIDGLQTDLSYINSINPNDIADVTILKSASATALYGPEGVNGVFVVTTKKGKPNKAPQIQFGQTAYFEPVAYFPELQTKFGSGSGEDVFGDGAYDPIENQSWGPIYTGLEVGIGRDVNGKPAGTGVAGADYQKIIYSDNSQAKKDFFETGRTLQTDFSLTAGDNNSSYFFSFQNIKTTGTVPKDATYRRSLRLNADKTIGKFKIAGNIQYTNRKDETTSIGVYNLVINSPGSIPLSNYKNYQDPTSWAHHDRYFNDYYENPYEALDRSRTHFKNDKFVGGITMTFKPASWLTLTERPGLTLNNSTDHSTVGSIYYSAITKANAYFASSDKTGSVADGSAYGNKIQNELIANMDKKFGKFRTTLLVGNLIRDTYNKSVDVSGSNLAIPTLYNINSATGIPGANSSFSQTRNYAVYGQFDLNYKGFANIQFTGRNDWDSRLAKENRSFFYPGVNGALILSEMLPSIVDNKILNYAKISGGWSKAGNVNINAYSLDNTFGQSGSFPYGSLAGYTASGSLLNPNIKPEIVESMEVGTELSFFDGRAGFEGSYYIYNNDEQVIDISVSTATGFGSTKVNAAKFWNKGFDLDLKLIPVRTNSITWNLNATYSYNDSKVLSLYQGVDQLGIGNTAYVITGLPAYTHRISDWVRDPEGRVVVNSTTGLPSKAATTIIGDRVNPKHIIGVNTEVNYKAFSFSAVAEYRGGNYIYNDVGSSLTFTGIDRLSAINNRQKFVFPNSSYTLDGGKTYVANTDIAVNNANYAFLQGSTFRTLGTNYYVPADFWKLREVTLAYSVPAKLLAKTKYVKRATFALIGRNLLIIKSKANWWTDPEFSTTTGNPTGTTSISQTPPTRIFGANLNVTF
ncbi:SusC/RagA family TonB-linked outer membrane protein [Hufsiella ginkgonis]|uniref:SusC/RagA family TonB-linked outer membrane protein n=1 Tax=Hufsiella ginkgonis TaxID=2695274 RepID=A0A7K1Y395_9SPHI|nr:SusC/RagA family TonB-linked outer membrane protein [Hufsiella ginkgonis]MXV17755.1 SusC/RagA family TonB-linked outer membrane protein [Hufsiella ginkgonis]